MPQGNDEEAKEALDATKASLERHLKYCEDGCVVGESVSLDHSVLITYLPIWEGPQWPFGQI